MAKYKTKVHVPDQYVASNKNGFVNYTKPVQYNGSHEMDFEIRDLDDFVNLENLKAHYYYWDTKKEHPFYITSTFKPEKDIMIICGEDDAGVLGLDSPLDTTKYGLTSPYTKNPNTNYYSNGIDSYFKTDDSGDEPVVYTLSDFIKAKTVGDNIVFAAKTSNAKKDGDFLIIDGINCHESTRFDDMATYSMFSIANRRNETDIYEIIFPNYLANTRSIIYEDVTYTLNNQNIWGAQRTGSTYALSMSMTAFVSKNEDFTDSTYRNTDLIIPFIDSVSEGSTAGRVAFPILGYTFAKKENDYYILWCYNLESSGNYDYLVWSIMAVKDICIYRSSRADYYFDGVTKLGDYYYDPVRSTEYLLFGDNAPTPTPDNPYADEDNKISGGGNNPYGDHYTNASQGGNGKYDNTKETFINQPIDISRAITNGYSAAYWMNPTTSDTDFLGMITDTLYELSAPSISQSNFSERNADMYAKITNGIQRLFLLPFSNPGSFITSRFYIGGVPIWNGKGKLEDWFDFNTDYEAPVVARLNSGIKQVELIYPKIEHYYDNFLDYEPYTKTTCFIPFVGIQEIPTNQVYDAEVKVIYNINTSNGDFVAHLFIDGLLFSTNSGNMSYDVQTSYYNSNNAIIASIDKFANLASAAGNIVSAATPSDLPDIGGAISAGADFAGQVTKSFVPSVPSSVVCGQVGKNISWLMGWDAWISQELPKASIPKDYDKQIGYPVSMNSTLSNLTGYCKVSDIHLRCSATRAERAEIERLLKEGVILP